MAGGQDGARCHCESLQSVVWPVWSAWGMGLWSGAPVNGISITMCDSSAAQGHSGGCAAAAASAHDSGCFSLWLQVWSAACSMRTRPVASSSFFSAHGLIAPACAAEIVVQRRPSCVTHSLQSQALKHASTGIVHVLLPDAAGGYVVTEQLWACMHAWVKTLLGSPEGRGWCCTC
jgi:hypothetical protein